MGLRWLLCGLLRLSGGGDGITSDRDVMHDEVGVRTLCRGPLFASPSAERARASELTALNIITLHVFLVAGFGQEYVKIRFGSSIFITEVVLALSAIFGFSGMLAVPWDRLTKLVALFVAFGVGWVVLGHGLGTTGTGTKAFSFFVYAAFYFIVRGNARTDEDRTRILRAIVLACLVGAAVGLLQMQTGSLIVGAERPSYAHQTATGVSRWLPGEFSLYGMLGLIIVGLPLLTETRMRTRAALFLVPPAIVLILSQHRSGFLAFGIALATSAVFLMGSTRMWKGLVRLGLFAAVAFTIFAVLFGGSYLDNTLVRIEHTFDTEDGNAVWRLLSWAEVSEGVIDRPFGHGFAEWDFLFNMHQPLIGSHNCFLDLAYRIGVPGLIVFLAIPFVLIRQTRALVQRMRVQRALLAVIASAGMIAFLVFAFFNMVIEIPMMSVFFWILLAIGMGALTAAGQQPSDQAS